MKRKSLSVLRLYYFLVLVVLLQIRDYKPAYRNDLLMAYFGVLQCGFYELACYTHSAIARRDLRMSASLCVTSGSPERSIICPLSVAPPLVPPSLPLVSKDALPCQSSSKIYPLS